MTNRRVSAIILAAGLSLLMIAGDGQAQNAREGGLRRNRRDREGTLKVGDLATDFKLVKLEKTQVATPHDAKAPKPDEQPVKSVNDKTENEASDKTKADEEDDAPATVRLSSHRGKLPVVLIFGSYT